MILLDGQLGCRNVPNMQTIAIQLKAMQFVAHNAHQLAKGQTFLQDHEYLGELYPVYEAAYDAIIERSLGLGKPLDPAQITLKSAQYVDPNKDTNEAFKALLNAEEGLREFIKEESDGQSIGTQNLLAQLADDSEARTYKIQQRLA